jgi:hypothetical protein
MRHAPGQREEEAEAHEFLSPRFAQANAAQQHRRDHNSKRKQHLRAALASGACQRCLSPCGSERQRRRSLAIRPN